MRSNYWPQLQRQLFLWISKTIFIHVEERKMNVTETVVRQSFAQENIYKRKHRAQHSYEFVQVFALIPYHIRNHNLKKHD